MSNPGERTQYQFSKIKVKLRLGKIMPIVKDKHSFSIIIRLVDRLSKQWQW